jgi:hypothetical protein
MKELDSNFLTRHWGEEEIPRYEFLAWLQGVHSEMDKNQLFPLWESTYSGYLNLKATDSAVDEALKLTPQSFTGVDMDRLKLNFVQDASTKGYAELQVLKNRIAFARPLFKSACKRSELLRKDMSSEIALETVGLHVLNRKEGLLLAIQYKQPEVWAWKYQLSVQTNIRYPHTAIRTQLVGKYKFGVGKTLISIKNECQSNCGWGGSVVSAWVAIARQPMPMLQALKPLGVMKLAQELKEI